MFSPETARSNRLHRIDPTDELLLTGWRETVALPELGIEKLHAKLDSGAHLSSLHAIDIERFTRRQEAWVRFHCWSDFDDETSPVLCEALCVRERTIRSSNGEIETRPTIQSALYLGGFRWTIEITLSDRSSLECKLLLGRTAIADRCLIDCSRNHVLSRP